MLLYLLLGLLAASTAADDLHDYISNVDCQSGYMDVILNDNSLMANETYRSTDPNIIGLIVFEDDSYHNAKAENCSQFIAKASKTDATPTVRLQYNACNVSVIQPQGGDGYVAIPLVGEPAYFVPQPSTPRYTFQASCTYNSRVTQDATVVVTVPSGGGSGGDHGGSSGSDIKGLKAKWEDEDGNPIGGTKVNVDGHTQVQFAIEYTKEVYGAFLPVSCYISDRRYNASDNTIQKIPFVYGGCPAYYGSTFTYHFLKHKLFIQGMLPVKFAGSPLLYAHCELNLCVDADSCPFPACFTNKTASNSYVSLLGQEVLAADAKSSGHVYAVLAVSDGSGGSGGVGGGSTATIVGATLGSVLGLLVIAGVILGAFFLGRKKSVVEPEPEAPAPQADPAFANNSWMFYKIPRAKTPESIAPSTVY